jgi:hypothetical protein
MKNLTINQSQIIESLTKEFNAINNPKTEFENIEDYINSSVDEKAKYVEEATKLTAIYEEIVKEKVELFVERMNKITEKYDFDFVIHYIGKGGDGKNITEYYNLRIFFNGFLDNYNKTSYSEMYIYTEINHLHNHKSLESSNLSYRPSNDYNRENVTEKEFEKHIADLIIRKLKSKIK